MARRKLLPKKVRLWAVIITIAVIVLGQLLGWFDSPGAPQQPDRGQQQGSYEVARFVDGDTIVVDLGGKDEPVRMIGVDTPETAAPGTPVQCYGPAASAYTKHLIGNQRVRLERDPANDDRDRYNRLLRYVYLPDGRLVAEELIKGGYGFVYTAFPFAKRDAFVAAELEASNAGRGLWGNCAVTEKNGRKHTEPAE